MEGGHGFGVRPHQKLPGPAADNGCNPGIGNRLEPVQHFFGDAAQAVVILAGAGEGKGCNGDIIGFNGFYNKAGNPGRNAVAVLVKPFAELYQAFFPVLPHIKNGP